MAASHETQQGIQTEINKPKIPLAQLREQAAASRSGMIISPEESGRYKLPDGLETAANNGHLILIDHVGNALIGPKIDRPDTAGKK